MYSFLYVIFPMYNQKCIFIFEYFFLITWYLTFIIRHMVLHSILSL